MTRDELYDNEERLPPGERLYPSEAYVTFQGEQRKAMADPLATVSKTRLRQRMGRLSPADLEGIERAIKVQLGLGL